MPHHLLVLSCVLIIQAVLNALATLAIHWIMMEELVMVNMFNVKTHTHTLTHTCNTHTHMYTRINRQWLNLINYELYIRYQ